jgi:hypothetical protein
MAARVPTPAATVRVEPEPAPLLPPPMVAPTYPTYPSAAPYTKEQHLAAGSAALKKDVVEARAFGEGSNVTLPGGVHRGQTAEPGRRKLPLPLLIGGGAVAVIAVVVVIVLAKGGGKSNGGSEQAKSKRDHAGAKNVAAADKGAATESGSAMASETPDPDPTTASDPGGTRAPAGTKKRSGSDATTSETPGSGSDATVASNPPPTTPTAPTQIPSPPPAVAKRPAATLGGKKVVLEYDTTTPKEPPKKVAVATTRVDENAVKSARTAYFAGNKKLFAGDAEGAIKLYQQALGVYPGYVAGYRGLGLAYAQKGDKKNALKAFRTYLNAVPTAKDIALIKRRMTTLQR